MSYATQWIPPLPQNWEGRWDAGQRRYFYINHSTKATQWEDPRFQQRPTPTPAAAAVSLSPARGGGASSRPSSSTPAQSYPLQDLSGSSSSHKKASSSSHQSQQNEESALSEEVDAEIVEKLKRDYPKATYELIRDMLASCFNNERQTREQLDTLGFIKEVPKPQPRKTTASTPKELTDVEKAAIHAEIVKEHPNLSVDFIRMSLEVVKYDKTKFKALLQRFMEDKSNAGDALSATEVAAGSATASSTSSSSRTKTSYSSTPSPRVGDLEPMGLSDTDSNRPQGLGTSASSTATTGSSGSSGSGGRVGTKQFTSAIQVTNGGTRKTTTASPNRKKTVTTQPKKVVQTSSSANQSQNLTHASNKAGAMGPDASLRRGPDSSLLCREFFSANGPDETLRQGRDSSLCMGPDPSRVGGPSQAIGPDASIRCGPQSDFCATPTQLLVSHV